MICSSWGSLSIWPPSVDFRCLFWQANHISQVKCSGSSCLQQFHVFKLRNGEFSAISVNKDVTAISNSSPSNKNLWGHRAPGKNNACYPATIELLPLPERVLSLGECEKTRHRKLAPHGWDEYERDDFSKPRLLHLPVRLPGLIPWQAPGPKFWLPPNW